MSEPPSRPPLLVTCTPTQLGVFLECPRRYRLTYLDRPRLPLAPPTALQTIGRAVHRALADWWHLPVASRTPEVAAGLLDDRWSTDGFRDADQARRWLDRFREYVRGYVAALDPLAEPLGVERTVAAVAGTVALSGRIDRLDDRGEELVVVDYKTGLSPPSDDDARTSMALALYAFMAERMFRRPCRRVELHHLPSGAVVRWCHTEEARERFVTRAQQIVDDLRTATELAASQDPGVRDAAFPARPGPLCGWCPVRRHCPAAVGAERDPWEGLDDEDRPDAWDGRDDATALA
ncbi:MAG: PD-(D/E)XK nuclease family protein [Acidothermus sp.]|nr:PD-(D/E)XK nuclease family protein [Acidothermus sp.]MCL6537082.1 PD-(D/E)XK nuclease family protein [Acidothermus sp.]